MTQPQIDKWGQYWRLGDLYWSCAKESKLCRVRAELLPDPRWRQVEILQRGKPSDPIPPDDFGIQRDAQGRPILEEKDDVYDIRVCPPPTERECPSCYGRRTMRNMADSGTSPCPRCQSGSYIEANADIWKRGVEEFYAKKGIHPAQAAEIAATAEKLDEHMMSAQTMVECYNHAMALYDISPLYWGLSALHRPMAIDRSERDEKRRADFAAAKEYITAAVKRRIPKAELFFDLRNFSADAMCEVRLGDVTHDIKFSIALPDYWAPNVSVGLIAIGKKLLAKQYGVEE